MKFEVPTQFTISNIRITCFFIVNLENWSRRWITFYNLRIGISESNNSCNFQYFGLKLGVHDKFNVPKKALWYFFDILLRSDSIDNQQCSNIFSRLWLYGKFRNSKQHSDENWHHFCFYIKRSFLTLFFFFFNNRNWFGFRLLFARSSYQTAPFLWDRERDRERDHLSLNHPAIIALVPVET